MGEETWTIYIGLVKAGVRKKRLVLLFTVR